MTPDEPRFVCHECIGDKILSKKVQDEGTQAKCSYCYSAKASLTLGDLSDLIHQVVKEHFEQIWMPPELPDDMYQPEEYLPAQWENHLEDIEAVIDRIAILGRDIATDVRKSLYDRLAWTVNLKEGEHNPYEFGALYHEPDIDPSDFRLAWREFRNEIHSHARFFGTTSENNLAEIFNNLMLLKTYWGDPVIREIKPGDDDSFIWRARAVHSGSELKSVLEFPSKELGPPPSTNAKSGRMNAEGVPVFYGALEKSTCVSEIRPPVGSRVVLGKFAVLAPIRILDLDALSEVYSDISYFDPRYAEERSRDGFLRELVKEMSRPVMQNEETLEYLPTQVVSEYLANRIEPRLHGMMFRSSQTGEVGRNIVLFNWASSVEAHEHVPETDFRVVIPRPPGIPPPGTEKSTDVTIQTEHQRATGEIERTTQDPTNGAPETRRHHRGDILKLDEQSLRVLEISRVKYSFEDLHLNRGHHKSAGTVRFRFDLPTPEVTLSTRDHGQIKDTE